MARKNNNPRQASTTTKTSKPILVKNRNVRVPNPKTVTNASKKSNAVNAANSRAQSSQSGCSTNTKNGIPQTATTADETSTGGAKDRSQLNFPYDIRINGFSSMINTVKKATPKVRKLLLDECDIIMECKFCRNLFRSVPNFLSHKQNYCKSMYHPTSDNGCSPLLQRPSSSLCGIQYHLDTTAIDKFPISSLASSSNYFPQGKDGNLNASNGIVVEECATRSSASLYNDIYEHTKQTSPYCEEPLSNEHVKLVIEPVNNRQDLIVFQRRVETDLAVCDSSNNTHDTREVVDRDTAILGPDGKVLCTGTELGIQRIVKRLTTQIELSQQKMVQDSTNLLEEKCDICKTVFNTEKALRQHRRDAPDCVKQSTIKHSHGPSKNGKLQATKRSVVQETSGLTAAATTHCNASSSTKRSKLDEDKAKSSLFVKQLFSKATPLKGVNSMPGSPTKSPLFTKKPLSANSPKTSPYKKIMKAKIPTDKTTTAKKKFSPVKKWKSNRDLHQSIFSCIKCSSTFRTKSDMSMHLAMCTGVINLSLRRDSFPCVDKKKICIQVRHNYSKPEKNEPDTLTGVDPPNFKPNSFTAGISSINGSSTSTVSDILLCTENEKSNMNELINSSSSDVSNVSVSTAYPYHSIEFKQASDIENKLLKDQSIFSNSNSKISGLDAVSVADSRGIDGLPGFVRETDNSNGSLGSDVDRESISNITDSGVSSTTTPSEGHSDGHGEYTVSPTDLQTLSIPSTSSKKVKSVPKSEKSSNPEDRVLTPKNKNLRLTVNSRKRKSSRIQHKDSELVKKPTKKK